ncbi:DEAD/DEAH box helicase [Helicobacter sp. T3_23-1059]
MQYSLRLRFSIISDKICVEFQKCVDKLAPAIRTKSVITNANLSDNERELLIFLQQILGKNPPFVVEKDLFCDLLFKKIENLNFLFMQNKNRSLKRIYKIPFEIPPYKFGTLKPTNIKIYIQHIYKHKCRVESYFDFSGNEIPLGYNFLIIKDKMLFKMDTAEIISKANSIVSNIFDNSFSFDELHSLKNEFIVLIKSLDKKQKSVSFGSNSNGFLSFDRDLEYDTDLYSNLLEAYLRNRNYVELDDRVLFFKDSDLSEKAILQIVQKSNMQDSNIAEFLEKIKNLALYPCDYALENIKNSIKVELKTYQIEGVLWLCNLYKNNAWGGLLADDMGLGKTLQTICFFVANHIDNILIISPASLVQNWKNEILKFTHIDENDISTSLQLSKIQIISYESARINFLKLPKYQLIILDESQKIKNNKTQIFNAINQINRDFTIIISGTPIENSLLDLWNMMSAVNANFKWLYERNIAPFMQDSQNAIHLSIKLLAPFIKRRKKDEVLNLPHRHDEMVLVDFSDSEKEAYNDIYKIFCAALKSKLSARANFVILQGLLRLRQFCSIHHTIPTTLYNCQNLHDSKLNALLRLVNDILDRQEKVIIFSQFTKSLEILKSMLDKTNFLYLDGSVSKNNRVRLVEQFQAQNSPFNVFLVSLKAGGVGLNLTNAQNAIMLEPWFNPAIEEQAFSRIYRIGQNKQVHIYRLLYANSIEMQINSLINHKLNLSQNLNKELLKMAKNMFSYD